MGVINKGHTFTSGENVTADKLNNLADDATFNSNTTDNTTLEVHSTSGYLKVKDLGIDTAQLAAGAVTTDKIANANVTYAKIQNVAANSVIGNPTSSDATPQAISIADLSTDVVAAINNSTPHTSDTDSDGTNDTGGSDGLMSAEDKTKLDGIAEGAEVNPTSTDELTEGTTNLYNQNHSGDVTGSTTLTLATVNSNIGSFTNANITVNAKGLVTAASSSAGLNVIASGVRTFAPFGGGNSNLTGCSAINTQSNSTTFRLNSSSSNWFVFHSPSDNSVTVTVGYAGNATDFTISTSGGSLTVPFFVAIL